MKKIYILVIALLLSTYGRSGTYYWNGSGTITSTSSWGTNQNGSGTNPSNFTTSGDVFWVANSNTTTTLSGTWTLGSGVVLHIGSGTTTTINGAYWSPTISTGTNTISSGSVIVEKRGTLQLGTATMPTFATTQGDSSTIILAAGGSIPSGITYGNLVISAGSPSFATGTTNIVNSFYVTGGTVTLAASASASYTLNITDSFVIAGSGSVIVAATNAVTTTTTVGRDLISRTTANRGIYFQSTSGAPANTAIIQVNGNVNCSQVHPSPGSTSAGVFVDWGNANNYGTNVYIGIKGNYTHSGNTKNYLQGSFDAKGFVFNGTSSASSPQIFTHTTSYAGGGNPYTNIVINSGAYVKMASNYPIGNSSGGYKSQFRVLSGGTLDCSTFTISGGVTTAGGGFQADPGSTILTGNTAGFTTSASISAVLTTAVGLSTGAYYGFNGSSAQVTGTRMPTTVSKLIINNTAGVTLSQATSDTILTFTAGKLTTNGNNITVVGGVTGAGTSSYVNTNLGGALIKPITGLTTLTYEVGDTSYAPVNLTLSSAGSAGTISVISKSGYHPNYGTSCFSNAAYDSHYWTIANTSVAGPSTVTAKFNYNSGDIVGGSNSSFVGQRYASSAWSGGLSTTNGSSPYYSSIASIVLASLPGDYQFSTLGNPSVNPTPSSLTFASTAVGSTSATVSATILGCTLTPASGNLTVTAPSNFKVFNGSAWVTSYTIAYTGGAISSAVTIPAQFAPASAGYASGNITISGGGLSSPATIGVAGNSPSRYYSKSTGNLNAIGSWGMNADGTGAAPGNFNSGDTFIIVNNLTPTLGAGWTTTGSTVYLGNGTDTINYTIPASFAMTGTVNVKANAKLTITNGTLPTLGVIDSGSTIIFNSSSLVAFPVTTYGHVIYAGSGTANFQAGTTIVKGNLTLSSSTVYIAKTAVTATVNISGDMVINNTGALVMANAAGATCAPTVNINGNLTCTSTAANEIRWHNVSGAAPTAVMQVNGNVSDNNTGTVDANFIDWGDATALGPNSYLGLKGNLSLAGRNRMYLLGNFSPYGIVFNGAGSSSSPQTFYWNQTATLAVNNGYCNYTVNSGTYVKMTSNMRMGTNTSNVNWQFIFRVKNGGTLDCDTFVISDGNSNGSNGFQVESGGTLVSRHPNGISGNITAALSTGTGLSTGGNYVFAGAVPQVTSIRMPAIANKITVNNTSGVSLTGSESTTTLELLSGILYTGLNSITATSVSGGSASSYVYANASGGSLNRPVSGLTTLSFPVGDSTYAPVDLTLSGAGTSGTIGIGSEYDTHPAFTTARVSSAHYAKHYWTITNNAVAGPSTITPQFNYNAGDIVGGTNAAFYAKRYVSGSWQSTGAATNSSSPYYTSIATIPLGSLQGVYQAGDSTDPGVKYYSNSFGYLDGLSTWGVNSDGSGTNPSSFTHTGDTFLVRNNLTPTLNNNWNLNGVLVVVGDSTSSINLTVPASYAINTAGGSVVSLTPNATLTLNNNTIPDFGTLASSSTVTYNASAALTIPATTFGNFNFNGISATHSAGTTTFAGNYSINTGTVTQPSSSVVTCSAGVNVLGTSTYEVANTTLPNFGTLSDTSTVILSGTGAITIPARTFGNLSYTGAGTATHTSGTTNINGTYNITTGKLIVAASNATYTVNVAKDLNLSGTGSIAMATVTGATCTPTLTIGGNLNCSTTATSAGTSQTTNTAIKFAAASAAGASPTAAIQVNGNVNHTSNPQNFLDWGEISSGTSPCYLGIKGNFTWSGNSRIYYHDNGLGGFLYFNGTSPQTFTYSGTYPTGTTFDVGSSHAQYCNYVVNSGAYVNMVGNLPLGNGTTQFSSFTVNNGGTLDLGASGIISGGAAVTSSGFKLLAGGTVATANSGGLTAGITTSTTTFTAGANYIFYGSTSTPFPSVIATNAPASVTINAPYVTANYTFSPSTSLTINSADTLDMANLVLGGAFTPTNNGLLRTQSTSTTSIPTALNWGSAGTVEFNRAAGGQTIVSGTYYHLTNSNTAGINNVIAGGTVNVNGDLTLTNGSILSDNGRTITLAGNIYGTGLHFSTSSGKITMTGTNKTISGATLGRLRLDNAAGFVTLTGSPLINTELVMASGNIKLDTFRLQIGINAGFTGGGSSSAMVIASGTGVIRQLFSSSFIGALRTYPMGDTAGNYSPLGINFTSGSYSTGAYMDINLRNQAHPNNANTNNYLKRYWRFRGAGLNSTPYTVYCQYAAADVVGFASNISCGEYIGALPWVKTNATDTVNQLAYSNTVTDTIADFSGITTANPVVSISPASSSICIGGSVTLTASASGDPALSYSWTPGATLSGTSGATVVANPTSSGTYVYSLTVTDGNGIASVQTATVTVAAYPAISLGTSPAVCQPSTSALLSYTASGSPTTYAIAWDTAALTAGFSNISGASIPASYFTLSLPGGAAGTFSGTITVSSGTCSSSAHGFAVSIYAQPVAAITAVTTPCSGHSANIDITGTPGATISFRVDSGAYTTATIPAGGIYTWTPGAITSAHVYTLHQAYNPACAHTYDTSVTINPIPMEWVGGTAGNEHDWSVASNWSCGFVPSAVDAVRIPVTTYFPAIGSAISVSTAQLTIDAGAHITIGTSGTLHVKGNLNNNGVVAGYGTLAMDGTAAQHIVGFGNIATLEVNNANGVTIDSASRVLVDSVLAMTTGTLFTHDSLVIHADTTKHANVAPMGTSAAISGMVKVEQNISGSYRRYRFWGHPFSNTIPLSQMQNDIDITGTGGSTNGFTFTVTNSPSAYRYSTLNGNSTLSYDPGWKPFTNALSTAADSNKIARYQGIRVYMRGKKGEGLGYATYRPSATVIAQWGYLNQGRQVMPLTKGSSTGQDYNLLCNPYAAPVDLGTILFNAKVAGNIIGGYYVWNPFLGVGGQFISTPISTVSPTAYYIDANTAFEVRASHNGDTLIFNESDKGTGVDVPLLRTENVYTSLNIYDSQYHLWDMLRFRFDGATTDEQDLVNDVDKLMGGDLNFYSLSSDGKRQAIDVRPFSYHAIPLGITSGIAQEFIIRADEVAIPEGSQLYLHDKLLNNYTLLVAGAEYRFSITKDATSQGNTRFELTMKPAASAVGAFTFSLEPNPAIDAVNIGFSAASNPTVTITDFSGVTVYTQQLTSSNGTASVSLNGLASGVYLVTLSANGQQVVKRLVKE